MAPTASCGAETRAGFFTWENILALGATLEAIQGAMTHTNKVTTLRYLRGRRTKKLSEIAEARNSKRAAENGGGTG